jgi:hypothetical protein
MDVTSGFKDLDSEFEKQLCDLWDITVEKDVCIVLDEFNSIQIFDGFMRKFGCVYPRAIEILIGIFVNMATLSPKIGLKLVSNKQLVQYLLFNILCQFADVPTIIQVVRLFTLFLTVDSDENKIEEYDQKKQIKQLFVENLKYELNDSDSNSNWQEIIEKFYFILENSLNPTLLDSTSLLLFNLLDSDDQILNAFTSNHKIIDSICTANLTRIRLDRASKSFTSSSFTTTRREENDDLPANANGTAPVETPLRVNDCDNNNANSQQLLLIQPTFQSQISEDDTSSIDHLFNKFFLCLQTISTCESGAMCIFSRSDSIVGLFDVYLEKLLNTFNDWEIKSTHSLKASIGAESVQNLLCLLSVLNCVFPDETYSSVVLDYHGRIPKFFLKFFTLCNYHLSLFEERSIASTNNQYESYLENFNLVKANMKDLFSNLIDLKNVNDANLNKLFSNCFNFIMLH